MTREQELLDALTQDQVASLLKLEDGAAYHTSTAGVWRRIVDGAAKGVFLASEQELTGDEFKVTCTEGLTWWVSRVDILALRPAWPPGWYGCDLSGELLAAWGGCAVLSQVAPANPAPQESSDVRTFLVLSPEQVRVIRRAMSTGLLGPGHAELYKLLGGVDS